MEAGGSHRGDGETLARRTDGFARSECRAVSQTTTTDSFPVLCRACRLHDLLCLGKYRLWVGYRRGFCLILYSLRTSRVRFGIRSRTACHRPPREAQYYRGDYPLSECGICRARLETADDANVRTHVPHAART